MDILNIVFTALNLLVSVVHVTWMIAKDVFLGLPQGKALFGKMTKKNDRP